MSATGARLASAIIDAAVFIVAARQTVSAEKRRFHVAAVLQGIVEDSLQRVKQPFFLFRLEGRDAAERQDPCVMTKLVGITVANAGKHMLIDQRGFQNAALFLYQAGKLLCGKQGVERLGTELRQPVFRFFLRQQMQVPEAQPVKVENVPSH